MLKATRNAFAPRLGSKASLTMPAIKGPKPMPKKISQLQMARAVARRFGGKTPEINEWEAGVPLASPMPTPKRARQSRRKLPAAPQAVVAALQNVSQIARVVLREVASPSRPSGTPARV